MAGETEIPGADDARAQQAQAQQRIRDNIDSVGQIPQRELREATWDEMGPSQKLERLRVLCEAQHEISMRLMELVAEMGRGLEVMRAHTHTESGRIVVPIEAVDWKGGVYGDLHNLLHRIKQQRLF